MKKLLLLIVFPLFAFQCSDETNASLNDELVAKKQEIVDYINSFDCSDSCNYIAFGSKPCGGPREFLLFSSNINLDQLQQMVTEYNELDYQNNINTNAVSDCAVVLPPNTVDCVNGDCVVIID
jgi:hypothetical protein